MFFSLDGKLSVSPQDVVPMEPDQPDDGLDRLPDGVSKRGPPLPFSDLIG